MDFAKSLFQVKVFHFDRTNLFLVVVLDVALDLLSLAYCLGLRLVKFFEGFFVATLDDLELAFGRLELVGFDLEAVFEIADFFTVVCDVFVFHLDLRPQLSGLAFVVVDAILVALFSQV